MNSSLTFLSPKASNAIFSKTGTTNVKKGKQQFPADSFLSSLDDGVGRPGCCLLLFLVQSEEVQK